MTKPSKLRVVGLFSVALLVSLARPASAEFVIDDFDTDQFLQVFGSPSGNKTGSDVTDAPEAVGGERDITVTRNSSNSGSVAVDVNLSVTGILSFASGANTTGTALISWDGDDNSAALNHTGLGGVDVTQSGANTHVSLNATSDLGDDIVLTFYTDASNYSQATLIVPANYPTYQNFLVPLASFTAVGGTGANFANIGAITMEIVGTGVPNLDLSVDVISVLNPSSVPEPSMVMLGGAGIVLFGIRRLLTRIGSKATTVAAKQS